MTRPELGPEQRGLESKAARGAGWVAAGALVSNVVASAVMLVLAAVLTPADLGVLAIGQLVFVIGNTLQDVGLWDVLVYYRGRAQDAAETVLLCWLSVSAVLAVAIAVGSPLIAAFFGEPRATPVVAVSGLLLLCYAAAGVPQALQTRSLDLRRRAQGQGGAVLLGGSVTVLLVTLTDLGIAAMVLGQVVSGLGLVSFAWAVGPRVRPRWRGDVLMELLGYGRHVFGAALFSVVQKNVDYLVVGRVLGAAGLGVYSLAFRLSFLPYALVTTVLASTMFALACRVEGARTAEVLLGYTRTTVLLVAPLATCLAVFAPAVTLLGEQWSPAVPVVRALGGYVLLASVATLAESGLRAVGRPDLALVCSGLHLALLLLALLAVTADGVTAVAVARLVVAAAVAVLGWLLLSRATGLRARRALGLLVLPALGCVALAATAVLTSWSPAGDEPVRVLPLVLQVLAALSAYVVVLGVGDRDGLARAVGVVRRRAGAQAAP